MLTLSNLIGTLAWIIYAKTNNTLSLFPFYMICGGIGFWIGTKNKL
jgi:hypothetical protein